MSEQNNQERYLAIVKQLVELVGGQDNIVASTHCATRLRFDVKDSSLVDDKAVKAAGAAGVIKPGKNACQVVIGPKVQFVYDELKKML